MNWDEYLKMIDKWIEDHTHNAAEALKKYNEAQTKLDAIIQQKETYLQLRRENKL